MCVSLPCFHRSNANQTQQQPAELAGATTHMQNDEFLRLAINAIHMDLICRNEAFETLALSFIGNGVFLIVLQHV